MPPRHATIQLRTNSYQIWLLCGNNMIWGRAWISFGQALCPILTAYGYLPRQRKKICPPWVCQLGSLGYPMRHLRNVLLSVKAQLDQPLVGGCASVTHNSLALSPLLTHLYSKLRVTTQVVINSYVITTEAGLFGTVQPPLRIY